MKKRLVLTVALAALLTLAGCGPTSTNTGDSNSATSSQSVDYTAIAITNKTALTAAWKAGEANRKVSLSITPAANDTALLASGELVVASSDTTVISVVGEYLTPVKAGKATITVTLGKVSDSVEITVLAADNDYAAVTLAEGTADGLTNGVHTYISQVKVASFKAGTDGGTYGNFNVTDADGKNNTIVYGATASLSALTYDATKKIWTFSNPKDFMANEATKAIKVGDMLDLVYIRADYNTTKEICGVIIGINGVAIANRGTAAAPLTSDEVAALTDQQKLYTYYVSGKISAWSGTATDGGDYGNFMLKSDGATGDAITVYGASAAGTLAYDFSKNATIFTNAKDWKTNAATKDLKIGDTVTLQVIRADYKTTKEIIGIVVPTSAKVDPVIADKSIKDVAAYTAASNTVIHVSGIWAENHGTIKYGTGYLMDPTTGDVVLVYGCSKTATGLAKTDSGLGYYTGAWTNPQDFAADTLTLGSYITIEGIVDYFSSSKTVELEGVITTEVKPTDAAYTYKYAASATTVAATDGTVALSKTSELAFGEAVTITATAASGKKIDTVVVDHGYGKEYAKAGTNGTYTFNANVTNIVTVNFVDDVAPTGDVAYDVATAFKDVGSSYVASTQIINGVTFTAAKVAYNKQSAWTESLAVMGKGEDTIEIAASYAFNKVALVGVNWGTDATTMVLEYWDTTTSAYVADATAKFVKSGTNDAISIVTTSTFSVTKARIHTTGSSVRAGVKTVTLTYPTV
jgi:hypothetical protein